MLGANDERMRPRERTNPPAKPTLRHPHRVTRRPLKYATADKIIIIIILMIMIT